jgi:4'-phosphopantetheinyl transferase
LDDLDDGVRERISRMRAEDDRARHATGVLLAAALTGRAVLHEVGKRPAVVGGGLHVSIAHASCWVGVAVAPTRVGVDVEAKSSFLRDDRVARAFLSHSERCTYRSVLPDLRAAWLARIWTAKEAVLKLTGDGLRRDPREIELELSDTIDVRSVAFSPELPALLQLFDVAPDGDYAATVAIAADVPVNIVALDGDALLQRPIT